jgi:hypothetical protein
MWVAVDRLSSTFAEGWQLLARSVYDQISYRTLQKIRIFRTRGFLARRWRDR